MSFGDAYRRESERDRSEMLRNYITRRRAAAVIYAKSAQPQRTGLEVGDSHTMDVPTPLTVLYATHATGSLAPKPPRPNISLPVETFVATRSLRHWPPRRTPGMAK